MWQTNGIQFVRMCCILVLFFLFGHVFSFLPYYFKIPDIYGDNQRCGYVHGMSMLTTKYCRHILPTMPLSTLQWYGNFILKVFIYLFSHDNHDQLQAAGHLH